MQCEISTITHFNLPQLLSQNLNEMKDMTMLGWKTYSINKQRNFIISIISPFICIDNVGSNKHCNPSVLNENLNSQQTISSLRKKKSISLTFDKFDNKIPIIIYKRSTLLHVLSNTHQIAKFDSLTIKCKPHLYL